MKNTIAFLALLLCYSIFTQNDTVPRTEFTKMYFPIWPEAKQHCLEVANAVPESLNKFRFLKYFSVHFLVKNFLEVLFK